MVMVECKKAIPVVVFISDLTAALMVFHLERPAIVIKEMIPHCGLPMCMHVQYR